jgi:nucleoside-diphosphate-sugar epimerase
MGVTNQLLDHDNEDETTPLPPWETYQCAYDISKRQGEDLIVNATSPNFQTGILRLGTILGGTSDYVARSALLSRPGTVLSARREPSDWISAWDISGAMLATNDKLDTSGTPLSGKPLFVTKCKHGQPTGAHEVGALYAEELGWKLQQTPDWLINILQYGFSSWDAVKAQVVPPTPENTAGFPLHLQLQSGKNRLTFRNDLAYELLNWQPEETWMDAVKRISADFREEYPQYQYR